MTQHAKNRLMERHGINATEADMREIRRQVREDEALLMRRCEDGGKKLAGYVVRVQGKAVKILYDDNSEAVITVYEDGQSPFRPALKKYKRRKPRLSRQYRKRMGRRPPPDEAA